MSRQSVPFLHVYGQEAWHDPVVLVGNRKALEDLREAIDDALATGASESRLAFPNDGEGYNIFVVRKDEDTDDLALPYSSPEAKHDESRLHPMVDGDAVVFGTVEVLSLADGLKRLKELGKKASRSAVKTRHKK